MAAARRFQVRSEATIKAKSLTQVHVDYRIRRYGLVSLWRMTESHVRLYQKTADSTAFKFLVKVREQMRRASKRAVFEGSRSSWPAALS